MQVEDEMVPGCGVPPEAVGVERAAVPLLTEAALTIGGTLRAFGYAPRPSGSHGACTVTSHRGQETEAG